MNRKSYNTNILTECQERFNNFYIVICSGNIVNQMFNYCMAEGIKIMVEKISETEYKFKNAEVIWCTDNTIKNNIDYPCMYPYPNSCHACEYYKLEGELR